MHLLSILLSALKTEPSQHKKAATIAVYLHHLFAIRIELQPTRCFKVTIDKFYFCGWCRSYTRALQVAEEVQ